MKNTHTPTEIVWTSIYHQNVKIQNKNIFPPIASFRFIQTFSTIVFIIWIECKCVHSE